MLTSTRMELMLAAIVFATLVGCSPSLRSKINEPYEAKTICEVTNQLIAENGMKVLLEADFKSDGLEYAFLFDRHGCPGVVVYLYDGTDLVKDEVYKRFMGIQWEDPELKIYKVHVNVYGILKLDQDRYKLYATRYLEVREMAK
jgi:hypothetical protein